MPSIEMIYVLLGFEFFNIAAYCYIRYYCRQQYNFYQELAALRKGKFFRIWLLLVLVNIGLVLLVLVGKIHFIWLLCLLILQHTIDVLLFVNKRHQS